MQESKPYVIVAAVDYSNTGDLALDRAFELATERRHAEVHIVHVLQTPSLLAPIDFVTSPAGPDPQMIQEGAEQLRVYADKRLQEFKARVSASGERVLFERAVSHLRLDAAAHEIAQLASDLEAELVVVGTHGRRGASRLLVGSVAEGVVRLAPCPVLVVREKITEHAESAVPRIEPPCSQCISARRASAGKELWCAQHRERHGRRHTYHYSDRSGAETNFPLVVPE